MNEKSKRKNIEVQEREMNIEELVDSSLEEVNEEEGAFVNFWCKQ